MDEEERKKQRRISKAASEKRRYARLPEAKKEEKKKAMRDRYNAQSAEQRSHQRSLERQTWRKRKLAKMSPDQRQREIDRWYNLQPEEQEAENTLEAEMAIRNSHAIDDLGTDTPDYTLSLIWSYARDKKVRGAVLKRAKGKCEYCGNPGFMTENGKRYLETHHVIALADEGVDKITNVIALCPNDHREAHFGRRRAEIEEEMIFKLKTIYS